MAASLSLLGNLAARQGDEAQSRGYYDQSMALVRTHGLPTHVLSVLVIRPWFVLWLEEIADA
jgi:hypothetical protein